MNSGKSEWTVTVKIDKNINNLLKSMNPLTFYFSVSIR